MRRLTEKDDLGNWGLKGVKWEQLQAGHMITLDVAEKLYGALCKLKDYENTKCSPEDVETLIGFGNDSIRIIARYVKKCRWIPVEEQLPEDGIYLTTFNDGSVGQNEAFTGMCGIENGKWDEDRCVIAWMPLPEPYREKVVVKPITNTDWQDHYMDRFEKVE